MLAIKLLLDSILLHLIFKNFLGGMLPDPHTTHAKCALHTKAFCIRSSTHTLCTRLFELNIFAWVCMTQDPSAPPACMDPPRPCIVYECIFCHKMNAGQAPSAAKKQKRNEQANGEF